MHDIPSQVLFLPGASGDARFWEPLAELLAIDVNKVLLGYPWFANAEVDAPGWTLSQLVGMVTERIDRPTALVAQSMGGVLAILAALQCRSWVTHLVLAATSGGLPVRTLGGIEWQREFKQRNPSVPDWVTSFEEDLSESICSISIPTLLLWGDSDPISPLAVGERLNQLLSRSELRVCAGGDHDFVNAKATMVAPWVELHLTMR